MNIEKVDCVLRFKEVETEQECTQLREILDILDIKYTVERKADIDDEISYIEKKGHASERSFPFDFYDFALQAYVFGFDIAAILYSCMAVEIFLCLLLKKSGRNHEKRMRLRSAIDKAHNVGLLSEKLHEIAHRLRVLRNYYVHYTNHVEYFNEHHQHTLKIVKEHTPEEEIKDAREILDEFHRTHTKIKFLGVSQGKIKSNEMRKFLEWNEKAYQNWCKTNRYDLMRPIRDFDPERVRHISIQRFNALSAIEWTGKILRDLEVTLGC